MSEGYKGNWPNKLTWLVFTRLTDEGGYVEEAVRAVAKHRAHALRSFVEGYIELDNLQEMLASPLATDFIVAALDTVDWEYLAKKLREE